MKIWIVAIPLILSGCCEEIVEKTDLGIIRSADYAPGGFATRETTKVITDMAVVVVDNHPTIFMGRRLFRTKNSCGGQNYQQVEERVR